MINRGMMLILPLLTVISNEVHPLGRLGRLEMTGGSWMALAAHIALILLLLLLLTAFHISRLRKREEDSYRSLLENLQAAVLRISPEGTILQINDYTLKLLGRSRKSLVGRNVFTLGLLPSTPELKDHPDWNEIASGTISSRIVLEGGSRCFQWYLNSAGTNSDDSIVCIGMDISDRVKAESALKESDEKFRSFMDNFPAFAFIRDSEGRYIYANSATLALLKEPIENPELEDFIKDEKILSLIREAERRILQEGSDKETLEYELLYPTDSKPRYLHSVKFPIHLPGGETWLGGFSLDITETRAIEEQLNQSRKMEAIGELAGGIAHDFNNQLAGIMGYTDLLCHGVRDEQMEHYAGKLKDGVERASEVTRQLLSFSRKGKKENRPVDLNALINDLISLLSHSLNKQIRIQFGEKAEHPLIQGDPNLIQNALLNIAINARDAMDNRGLLIFTTRNISVDERMSALQGYVLDPGPYLKLSVEDTGSGIPREIKDKIFEPFFTTKEAGKGTGMGLAMVYRTMQDHKGNITVQSTENRGTVFSLYFPMKETAQKEPPPVPSLTDEQRSYRIAAVDDEAMIRDFLGLSLRGKGHDPVLFEDGAGFIDSLKKGELYDMVILDMIMPGMSGMECYRELIKTGSRIPVLLSSGYSRKDEVIEIMKSGSVRYIQKPYSIKELLSSIQTLMAESHES